MQALIECSIPFTITGVWDNGVDFTFVSLKSVIAHDMTRTTPRTPSPGAVVDCQNVPKPGMLAQSIEARFRLLFPGTEYAERVEEQERAPQADINPLCELDARYAYKRDLTE